LQQRVETILDAHNLNYQLNWKLNGPAFLTAQGLLINKVQCAIKRVCGYPTKLSTAGGTSDGRFIAPTGAELIELGPVNATIHKVDECVKITDLDTLTDVYQAILEEMSV